MMTQEQYIASRTPVVQAVAILAIFLVLAIVTAMATGDDDAILGMLFLGAPIAVVGATTYERTEEIPSE